MDDIEKVIVGIEHCNGLGCSMCPYKPTGYSPMDCRKPMMNDALELLKEYDAVKQEREPKPIVYTDNPYTGLPVAHCPELLRTWMDGREDRRAAGAQPATCEQAPDGIY